MPLFGIAKGKLAPIVQANFLSESKLQKLIESNLGALFNCRFVATEYPTGAIHSGRIDTLALSEDDNPVVIEYKKVESSDLINFHEGARRNLSRCGTNRRRANGGSGDVAILSYSLPN